MREYQSEASYMQEVEDNTLSLEEMDHERAIYRPFKATQYINRGKKLDHLMGKEMIGEECPTCRSKLVRRVRVRDGVQFVACDKTNRPRCPFSVGWTETLQSRTDRVGKRVSSYGSW